MAREIERIRIRMICGGREGESVIERREKEKEGRERMGVRRRGREKKDVLKRFEGEQKIISHKQIYNEHFDFAIPSRQLPQHTQIN